MEAFIGSWKLQADRQEGPHVESAKAAGIPDEFVDMFAKSVYTLVIEKDGDQYKRTFTVEGSPQGHVFGPYRLGEMFEFYDSLCKRTEQSTITLDGAKSKEVTVIKENPDISWTIHRYIQDGEMIVDTVTNDLKCKSYLKKV